MSSVLGHDSAGITIVQAQEKRADYMHQTWRLTCVWPLPDTQLRLQLTDETAEITVSMRLRRTTQKLIRKERSEEET